MKIKKGLALILALAMIITLMPTMAFASTTNTVDKTYSVAADEDMPTVYIDLKVTSTNGIAANEANKFKLTLENAEWNVGNAGEVTDDNIFTSNAVKITDQNGSDIGTATATATAEDSTTITFTAKDKIAKDAYIRLALNLHAGSDDGAVKVAIDGLDSAITSGTLTVATVGSGTTTATVTGKVKSFDRSTFDAAKVEITETAVNSITGDQIIKLTVPKGISWSDIKVTGDLVKSSTDVTENYDDNDGRTKYIKVTVNNNLNVRQSIVIEPTLTIGKDASNGDITLSIAGYKADSGNSIADADDLVIAVYGEENVTVSTTEEEDLPEVVAGYLTDKKDKNFVLQVTFKESLPGALSSGRYIDFDLPDEVQVVDDKDIKAYVGTGSSSYTKNSVSAMKYIDIDAGTAKDRSEFTLTVPEDGGLNGKWDTDKANTLTLYIPVTAKADFAGDIKMSIKGAKAGIEDTELVVGTVISPITVKADVTKVVNGAQQQATADITITENIPGYLTSDENENQVSLLVDTLKLTNGVSFTDADIEVTEGDLLIKNFKVNQDKLTFEIKDSSTKASEIKISNVEVAMSRILPEGNYDLKVGGNALIQNGAYNDKAFDTAESAVYAASVPYINITTAADTEKGVNATFTDGKATYTLNGETVEMDVAPYIDSNNRMLVPIRFAANAMGVSDDNIQWNGYTQTGTISGAMGVVRVTVGSTNLITSNGTITMDTVAVNTNNRIYVPVRYIANALGVSVSWDPATRTATFVS